MFLGKGRGEEKREVRTKRQETRILDLGSWILEGVKSEVERRISEKVKKVASNFKT
jgi:hypothetical protein